MKRVAIILALSVAVLPATWAQTGSGTGQSSSPSAQGSTPPRPSVGDARGSESAPDTTGSGNAHPDPNAAASKPDTNQSTDRVRPSGSGGTDPGSIPATATPGSDGTLPRV